MGDNVSDFLLKRLSQWGITRIFGFPGDGILGILGALDRHKDCTASYEGRVEGVLVQ